MIIPVTYARFQTLQEKNVGDNFRHNHQWYRINGTGNNGEVVAIRTRYRTGPMILGSPLIYFVEEA